MNLLVGALALVLVATPAMAQSRKDKKAAQKAAWEMEQKQKQEEAQLRHKLRMDSLANAQKVAEEAAKKAEMQAAAEKAEAEARARKAEQEMRQQEGEVVNMPCFGPEFYSTAEIVRATGIGESMNQQMAKRFARSAAIEELTSKINTAVQALIHDYFKSDNKNMTETFEQKMQGLTVQKIEQTTGYRTACEKYTTYYNNNDVKVYKCYVAIEIGADEILKPLYDGLQAEESERIELDYQQFKKEFEVAFQAQE